MKGSTNSDGRPLEDEMKGSRLVRGKVRSFPVSAWHLPINRLTSSTSSI